MTKSILGTFQTEEEALRKIDIYELSGHEAKNIVIFTNENNARALKHSKGKVIKTNRPDLDESSGLAKKVLTPTAKFELDSVENLVTFGLSLDEAEKAMLSVIEGKIVVLVDDVLRMGHKV